MSFMLWKQETEKQKIRKTEIAVANAYGSVPTNDIMIACVHEGKGKSSLLQLGAQFVVTSA